MSLLSVSDIHSFPQQGSFLLKEISFTQQPFQKIAIAGETGAGKTTLMKIIAGLIQPASGEIFFEGKKILRADWQLIPGQPGIAYLSQYFELRPHYRMEELLGYANDLPEKDAQALYRICRIDHLMKRKADELSGGEKQRIALARLLISSPRLLIMDEPFSNLDPAHKKILKAVINDISSRLKISCIMASHDPSDILPWADEILVLQNGELIQQGTPEEVYQRPVNEYAAALFGDYNIISKEDADKFAPLFPGKHGKDLFIRPEALIITDAKENTIKGKVITSDFYGAFFKITVDMDGLQLIVHSYYREEPGTIIYLKLEKTRSGSSHRNS